MAGKLDARRMKRLLVQRSSGHRCDLTRERSLDALLHIAIPRRARPGAHDPGHEVFGVKTIHVQHSRFIDAATPLRPIDLGNDSLRRRQSRLPRTA